MLGFSVKTSKEGFLTLSIPGQEPKRYWFCLQFPALYYYSDAEVRSSITHSLTHSLASRCNCE